MNLLSLLRGLRHLQSAPRFRPVIAPATLLSIPMPLPPFSYSAPIATTSHRRKRPSQAKRRRRRPQPPPPPDQAQLELAISKLPPRFSPADLATALSRLPDPRLCPGLLSWAMNHHPTRLRSGDDISSSPFLLAVKRLGSARLYRDMDSVASFALAFPSSATADHQFMNTLIYFYVEARMLSKAVYVYKRMRAATDPAARPTLATYNLLFTALLGRAGTDSYIHHIYMDTIRSLFRQMVESGVAPDRVALNAMVKGYAQSLHLNDALRVFHQMAPVYGCEPDEHTYNYLVQGLCAQGRTRNAKELFEEMRNRGMVPSGRVCNSMVSALAMAGELREAVEVMLEMARMGRAADRITCKTLLEEMCRQGRLKDAMQLLKEMEEKEMVDGWLYRELLHGIQDEFGNLLKENGHDLG